MRLVVLNPCHEDFDGMEGDDRTRFCAACRTYVHDLSEMTRDEAEAFMAANRGRDVCIRYLQGRSGEPRFRPGTTVWRLGFAAALSLAMAACTGHVESPELDSPEAGLVCRDASGYAVNCEELEYGAVPDELTHNVVVDEIDDELDDVDPGAVGDEPDEPVPDEIDPHPSPHGDPDAAESCPLPRAGKPAPETRKQARQKRRRSRKTRRRRPHRNLHTMGVWVMGR